MSTQYLFLVAKKAVVYELLYKYTSLQVWIQVQTQILDQSLVVMLRQLCYGKISFIVLVPECFSGKSCSGRS